MITHFLRCVECGAITFRPGRKGPRVFRLGGDGRVFWCAACLARDVELRGQPNLNEPEEKIYEIWASDSIRVMPVVTSLTSQVGLGSAPPAR